MSPPSGLPLALVPLLGLASPALAHPGVADGLWSELGHVLTHPDHVAALAGLGVLALGLTIVLWRSGQDTLALWRSGQDTLALWRSGQDTLVLWRSGQDAGVLWRSGRAAGRSHACPR